MTRLHSLGLDWQLAPVRPASAPRATGKGALLVDQHVKPFFEALRPLSTAISCFSYRPGLTIKHGEIKNLDLPGMAMLFQVKDLAMRDMVKPGDKVKFRAEKAGGRIVVTEIQVVK